MSSPAFPDLSTPSHTFSHLLSDACKQASRPQPPARRGPAAVAGGSPGGARYGAPGDSKPHTPAQQLLRHSESFPARSRPGSALPLMSPAVAAGRAVLPPPPAPHPADVTPVRQLWSAYRDEVAGRMVRESREQGGAPLMD